MLLNAMQPPKLTVEGVLRIWLVEKGGLVGFQKVVLHISVV